MRNFYLVGAMISATILTYIYVAEVRSLEGAKIVADAKVAHLREQGPSILPELLQNRERLIETGATPERLAIVDDALDQVCAQKDRASSALYWYTDLEQAKHTAQKNNQPILSLRMLGKLTDEYSCANSRFFRTILYSDPNISKLMRESFVLHWSSERPVPRVSIDFQDGRKLESTITGNSVHYVLDQYGHPIDAIPGMYTPKRFAHALRRSLTLVQSVARAHIVQPSKVSIQELYQAQEEQLLEGLDRELALEEYSIHPRFEGAIQRVGMNAPSEASLKENYGTLVRRSLSLFPSLLKSRTPTAREAERLATSKAVLERPTLREIEGGFSKSDVSAEPYWIEDLAFSVPPSIAMFASESRALMQTKTPAGDRVALSMEATLALSENVIKDTIRNEYLLRLGILRWIRKNNDTMSLDQLNEWVYANVFLTPKRDKWLGLFPSHFTGLERGGVINNS